MNALELSLEQDAQHPDCALHQDKISGEPIQIPGSVLDEVTQEAVASLIVEEIMRLRDDESLSLSDIKRRFGANEQ